MSRLPQPDPATLTPAQLRSAAAGMLQPATFDVPIGSVDDCTILGPAGPLPLPLRLYRPSGDAPWPVTVFFHGGGFVLQGLEAHDAVCRVLAMRARSLVIAVDYRPAPEHPWPAAVHDALAAVDWALQHAPTAGGDVSRLAVAGDSAGGNLAAVVAQRRRDAVSHQLLIYPALDSRCDSDSHRTFAEAPLLTTALMRWFWQQYLGTADGTHPTASPLRQSDLTGVADATVITAECDPLRDEGEAYAGALRAAGAAVTLRRWPGQFHGFVNLLGLLPAAEEALAFAAASLRDAWTDGRSA